MRQAIIGDLFRALINPGSDQANLFGSERLSWLAKSTGRNSRAIGTAAPVRAARTFWAAAGTSWTAATSGTSRTARPTGRWHCQFRVNLRNGDNERAVAAVARNDSFSVLAALNDSLQRREMKIASRSLATVAAEAGGFE